MRLLTLLAALCLPAVAIAAAPVRPFTIGQIFARPGLTGYHPEQVQWSPDGKHLTYLLRHKPDGKADLHIIDTATGKDRILLTAAQLAGAAAPPSSIKNLRERNRVTRYHVDSYHWAPKSDALYFVSNDEVYLYPLSGGKIRQLTHSKGEKRDPKLSPNEQWVSYLTNGDLHVESVKGGPVRTVVPHRKGILNGQLDWVYTEELELRTGYAWSPDSRYIAFMQFDENPVIDFPLVNYTEQNPGVYPQKYPQAGAPNPIVRLGFYDVRKARTTWGKFAGTPDTYLARFGWLPKGHEAFAEVLNRDQTDLKLSSENPADGKTQLLTTVTDPDWVDVRSTPHFLKSGGFVWSTPEDGWQHLYLYSDLGHKVRRLTTGDYNVVALNGIDENSGTVYFSRYTRGPLNTELYKVALTGGKPVAVTTTSGTHGIDMNRKASAYLDAWSTAGVPPSVKLVNLQNGKSYLMEAAPKLPYKLIKPKFTTITAGDGKTQIYASIMYPPGFDPNKKYPVIMYQYGGPDVPAAVRDAWGGTGYLFDQLLLDDGFILFTTDNRAATYFSHRDQALIKHHLGVLALQDQLAAAKWLKSQHYVDPARIGIWGWSYGGYMTTYALTRAPGVWRAGISVAPVTRWEDYDSIYTERYMGTPKQNPQGYKDSSSVESAGNLDSRLLLVAGTGDDNVHWQNTMQFVQALINAGKPYQLLIYPNRLHGISGPKARTHLFTAMQHFWLTQLMPPVPAASTQPGS